MEANYFTTLWWFLPYIDINQPWVYMFPIMNTPPISLPIPSLWLSQCTGFESPVSCIELGLVLYFTYGNYTCFNGILSNCPTLVFSHRVQKSVLYICVSFAVFHLSKFYIYELIYCIGVSPFDLLHSVQ